MDSTKTEAVSNHDFSRKVGLVLLFQNLFNGFALLFALLMTLDFIEFRLGLSDAAFYTITGACLVLAGLSYLACRSARPENYQPCPHCGEKILFFLRWRCDTCGIDQKRPRYLVERCGKCKTGLSDLTCPHCSAAIDLGAM